MHREHLIAEDRLDVGGVQHEAGPLIGVVHVDRHVGRTGDERAENVQEELMDAGVPAHPRPAARTDARLAQALGNDLHLGRKFAVAQCPRSSSRALYSGCAATIERSTSTSVRSGAGAPPFTNR